MEKFRFFIFKISRKFVFLGRVSKFLKGCQALCRDPASPVAEAMAEVPGPCSAYEATARPPARPLGRGACGLGRRASVPRSPRAPRENGSLSCFTLCRRHLPFPAALGRWETVSVVCGKPLSLQAASLSQLRPCTDTRSLQPYPATCVVRLSGHS